MNWLNYHHLRYFWMVAHEGGVQKAADALHVSAPSVSAQIRELEEVLDAKLFKRVGRKNVLTEAGQIALRYADEIFSLGNDLANALQQRPTAHALRLHVGVADSFPKSVTHTLLRPALKMSSVRVECREGKLEDLLQQLGAHRLDIVFADEAAPSSLKYRAFNHELGHSNLTFCAPELLARRLRKTFPACLNETPLMLPIENTPMRRALENWFGRRKLTPRVVAEFEDLALMKVMAAEEPVIVPLPTVALEEARDRYALHPVGAAESCRLPFFAITAERKITHPVVALLTEHGQRIAFA